MVDQAQPRPDVLNGVTRRYRTGHGNVYVTTNRWDDGVVREVFAQLGKAGSCDTAYLEGLTRMVTLALRSGAALAEVVAQLRGITCHPIFDKDRVGVQVMSAVDAVAKALAEELEPATPSPSKEA